MADKSILVRAYLAKAALEADPLAWLVGLRNTALDAVTAGDIQITSLAYEGGSGSGTTSMKAQDLLEILQLAIDELTEDSSQDGMIIPRFSCLPL